MAASDFKGPHYRCPMSRVKWTFVACIRILFRAVFVALRDQLDCENLVESLVVRNTVESLLVRSAKGGGNQIQWSRDFPKELSVGGKHLDAQSASRIHAALRIDGRAIETKRGRGELSFILE
jgi:hypothetical protein